MEMQVNVGGEWFLVFKKSQNIRKVVEVVCYSFIRNMEVRYIVDKYIQNWGVRYMQMCVIVEGDIFIVGGDDGILIYLIQFVVFSFICKFFFRFKEGGIKVDKCNVGIIIVYWYCCFVDYSLLQYSIGSVELKLLVDEFWDIFVDGESFYNFFFGLVWYWKLKNGLLDCCESLFFCFQKDGFVRMIVFVFMDFVCQ